MEIFGCKVFIKISNPKCGIKNAKIARINFIRNLMRFAMILLLFSVLFAENQSAKNTRQDFLTLFEYGRALYKNPRGIGCIKCHGDNAEGAIISTIYQNGKAKNIAAPDIRGVNFIRFESALKTPKGLMHSYNLTSSELLALYKFLNPNFKPPR